MYRPLPDGLTIKNSPIEGLGLFATIEIKANSFIGVTHIRDEQFENKYIRSPLGGFYNHSNEPTVMRMVSNVLPTLKFGDPIDTSAKAKKLKEKTQELQSLAPDEREKVNRSFEPTSARDFLACDATYTICALLDHFVGANATLAHQ